MEGQAPGLFDETWRPAQISGGVHDGKIDSFI